jgi:hypothetical protein
MASFPSPGRSAARRRDERGVAIPSPLVMLSVLAVAMASITFVATRDQAPTERRVDTATIASAGQTPSPTAEPAPTPTKTPKPKPKPQLERGEVYVEVYNNSGIRGLAAETAAKATGVGWAVVGEDNWQGLIPTSTVYFPPRLKAAGKQLALDLGIKRTAPAVGVMKRDRLTIILTADAPR